MQKQSESLTFNTIQDFFEVLDWSVDKDKVRGGFDIRSLADHITELPYQSPIFRINFFSFIFVEDAVGSHTSDGHLYDVLPGTILFNSPGHYRTFAWDCMNEAFVISVSESFLKENVHVNAFREFPFLLTETLEPKVVPPQVFAEFGQLCRQILIEQTTQSFYRDKIIGSLLVVILLKIKKYFWQEYDPNNEDDRSSQIVVAFKRCLERHLHGKEPEKPGKLLRVKDCAALLNLHPNHLNIIIKSKTGKSVSTWITEKTIIEAKAMLQIASLSVKETAYHLGFGESTHFSNYFKKYTNQSPTTYRKQHPSS